MNQDSCCSNVGVHKWIRPSIIGLVAGIIMFAAGTSKFIVGKVMLTGIGSMVLGVFDVSGHLKIALGLGVIAALIEVLGGFSFAIGCKKTSKYAAVLLSLLMGIILIVKLNSLSPLSGNLYMKLVGLLQQIQLDLLLFAVFFQKALKAIKCWFGMNCCGTSCCKTSCCSEEPKK